MKTCKPRNAERFSLFFLATLGFSSAADPLFRNLYHPESRRGVPTFSASLNPFLQSEYPSSGISNRFRYLKMNGQKTYNNGDSINDFVDDYNQYPETLSELDYNDNARHEADDVYENEDDYGTSSNESADEYRENNQQPPVEHYPPSTGGYADVYSRYKVREKIPGDTVYKRPKQKIVPIPPPCIREEFPLYSRQQMPPQPSTIRTTTKIYSGDLDYTVRRPKPKTRHYQFRSRPYVVKRYKKYSVPSARNVIIRHHTLPSKLIKEVHVHHHRPTPIIPVKMHLHKIIDEDIVPPTLQKRKG